MKAIDKLNDESLHKLFESNDIPNKDIIRIYRIFLQFICKDKNEIKNKDDAEFWKLVKDKIYNNKKDNLAEHVKELIKEIDFSDENLKIIDDMTKDCKEKIIPKYFNNLCATTGIFSMLLKEILEYCGIIIGKKTPLPMEYKRLEFNLKNYKDKDEKLNKLNDLAIKKK